MAVTYGFYDSLNHDRLYNAQQMSAIFDGIINDGVFMSVGNQFHTVAGTGMQVIVKSGRAWFDSTWTLNDAEYPLSIDAADVLLTRIDAVVLEVNSEVATRANTIKVVKGTPASTPAKPTLTNTATIHQHALAYVTVAKNTTAITNSMIEIVVGKTETPYVTAILQTTDITDLYNQWEDYFQTWFDTVRGTLDGDVALNLQNQITSLRRDTLKNTTPPIIGLPVSATPDDMFQALGNTGDLYVWRKTVTTAQEIPAGYTLENALENININLTNKNYNTAWFAVVSSVKIDDNGNVHFTDADSDYIRYMRWNSRDYVFEGYAAVSGGGPAIIRHDGIPGNFIKFWAKSSSWLSPLIDMDSFYFVPSDATVTMDSIPVFSKLQRVVGYAKIPAGTITTYPVSTNPNAYQEGEYGKAGYTLGDVKTGTFQIGQGATTIAANRAIIKYGTSVSVTDTGTASIASESELTVTSDSSQSAVDKLKGKFFRFSQLPFSSSAFSVGKIYFFPSNTVFTKQSSGNWYASKYQTVTSHGKTEPEYTIEYLGKLGDKARVQVLSYVGTGTYGESNPNSLTFDIVPKIVFIAENVNYQAKIMTIVPSTLGAFGFYLSDSTVYGLGSLDITITGKRISFFSDTSSEYQMNDGGNKFFAIAIG